MGLKYHIVVLIFALGFQLNINAQYITPIAVSNYGTVHSYHINPSLNAYSSYKWHINLAGAWVNINNNYVTHRMPFSAYRLPNNMPNQYQNENGNLIWQRQWLSEKLNGKPKQIAVASDVYGSSASVQIKTWRIGFISSAHLSSRLANLPENLAHAALKEFDTLQGAFNLFKPLALGGENTIDKFTIAANSRISAGFNVSKAIALDFNRQLLLGITIKRNWGMPGFFLHNSGLALKNINADSIAFMPTNIQMVTYGSNGKGMGYDIGATYVFNKKDNKRQGGYNKNQTKYFAKLGFAIMDIGKITYRNAAFTEVSTSAPIILNMRNFAVNNNNYEATADSFFNQFGTVRQYNGNYQVGLPTRLVVSGDFQIKKNVFIASVITQSLRSKLSKNARYQSAIMIAPRWEYKYFEFSLPALLAYDYRAFRMGASLRLGPLYLGSNSLLSFIHTKAVRDADIFIGIAFGNNSDFNLKSIFKRKKAKTAKKKMGCSNSF